MKRFLHNAAIASAIAGSFLGLRPIVRIFAIWLLTLAVRRVVAVKWPVAISPLLLLWAATLAHILWWNRLADLFSW